MSLLVEKDVVTLALALVAEQVAKVDDEVVIPRDNTTIGSLMIGVLDLIGNIVERRLASYLENVRSIALLIYREELTFNVELANIY